MSRSGLGMGAILGATAELATSWSEGVRVTAGAGPMLVTDAEFGSAAFAQGDVGLELRSQAGFAFAAGLTVAFALNHAGTPACGVDTCNSWVAPGDRLVRLRIGVNL